MRGKIEEALPFAARAVDLYRDLEKGFTENKILSGQLLASCYKRSDKFTKAIPFYQWSIEAVEESEFQKNLLPRMVYDLGVCQTEAGELPDAEKSLRKARKLYVALDKTADEADCLLALAWLESKNKNDDGAFDWLNEAAPLLATLSKTEPNSLYWLKKTYGDMAAIRDRQNKPGDAAKLRKKLDSILLDLGPTARKQLAKLCYDRAEAEKNSGQLPEAEKTIRGAIELYESFDKPDEYQAYSYVLLAQTLAKGPDPEASRLAFGRAVRLMDSFAKEDGLDKIWIHRRIGDFEFNRKSWERAVGAYESALAIAEKKSDDLAVLGPLADLVTTFGEMKNWNNVEAIALWQIAIVEKSKGDDAVLLIGPLQQLAWVKEQTKNSAAAEKLLKRALAIREAFGKPGDAAVFTSVQSLARFYQRDKRPESAETLYRKTVADWETKLGADSGELAVALKGFASFLAETGKYDEGEKLFRRSVTNSEKAKGKEDHPETKRLLKEYVEALEKSQMTDEAKAVGERLKVK